MVSLKYEILELTDCISNVSDFGLCKQIKSFHVLAVFIGRIFALLLVCRKYIFKKRIIKNTQVE